MSIAVILIETRCPTCHINYAVDSACDRAARTAGDWLYCPHGHAWHYTSEPNQQERPRSAPNLDQSQRDAQRRLEIDAITWRGAANLSAERNQSLRKEVRALKKELARLRILLPEATP